MVDRFRALTHVLRHESAFSLGTAGRKLRFAVETLQRWDKQHAARGPERTRLVRNAASALTAVVVQREALGMRDHEMVGLEYGITPEIWRSVGIVEQASSPDSGNPRGP